MTTEGVPKKRSFIIRDVYKLYRSISKLWPRDKRKVLSSSSSPPSVDDKPKAKSDPKLRTKSMPKTDPRGDALKDLPSTISQEARNGAREEGVSLCRVRSYRYDGTDFLQNKPSLSRSCSQNTATPRRSLSTLKRSKSSNRTDAYGFTSSIMRVTSTVQRSNTATNSIVYSSSTMRVAKPPPQEVELECTLEELCKGCTKKIKIKRDVITSTGEISQEEEMVKIKAKPGWRGGTKVTFEGKGNEGRGSLPADLTFVIVEKEHELFRRDGDDLEIAVEIPLVEALTGCDLSVPLPDGNNMNLRIDNVINPEHVTVIQGKGMPNPKENGKRGDLRIKFRTKFPEELTEDQRAEIRSILEDST